MDAGVRWFGEWGTKKMWPFRVRVPWMEDPQPDVSSCGGQSRVRGPHASGPLGASSQPWLEWATTVGTHSWAASMCLLQRVS